MALDPYDLTDMLADGHINQDLFDQAINTPQEDLGIWPPPKRAPRRRSKSPRRRGKSRSPSKSPRGKHSPRGKKQRGKSPRKTPRSPRRKGAKPREKIPYIPPQDGSFTILHFNDVYELESGEREPVGGAARFMTALRQFDEEQPLTLFSGDAFFPSLLSTITNGEHMVPVLNMMGVRASCVGNHDLDGGLEQIDNLIGQTNFPWLLSNAILKETKKPLANGRVTEVIEHNGYRIGLMGLIEYDWLSTLAVVRPEDVKYTDFVEAGTKLAKELREYDACHMVIALTHMRQPNDARLAAEAEGIDLVLGGHDHHYACWKDENTGVTVCKSGTDFKTLTNIKISIMDGKIENISYDKVEVTSDIEPHEEMQGVVDGYMHELRDMLDKEVGYTTVPLDGLFSSVRTKETNLGNFVADVLCSTLNDCVPTDGFILNSGTLRADDIIPTGPIYAKDIIKTLPMMDGMVVMNMKGHQLLTALENGVSKYPKLEGRFPQISGISFSFKSSEEPGSRVVHDSVMVQGAPLDLEKSYAIGTKSYLALGKDGYDVFAECEQLAREEECPLIPTSVMNFFRVMGIAKFWNRSSQGVGVSIARDKFLSKANIRSQADAISPEIENRIVDVDAA